MNFKRGLSDSEIKTSLFGFRPGQIAKITYEPHSNYIRYAIVKPSKKSPEFYEFFQIGELRQDKYGKLYIYFKPSSIWTFVDKNKEPIIFRDTSSENVKPLNDFEKRLISKWLKDYKYGVKDYTDQMNEFKKLTGLTPFA